MLGGIAGVSVRGQVCSGSPGEAATCPPRSPGRDPDGCVRARTLLLLCSVALCSSCPSPSDNEGEASVWKVPLHSGVTLIPDSGPGPGPEQGRGGRCRLVGVGGGGRFSRQRDTRGHVETVWEGGYSWSAEMGARTCRGDHSMRGGAWGGWPAGGPGARSWAAGGRSGFASA